MLLAQLGHPSVVRRSLGLAIKCQKIDVRVPWFYLSAAFCYVICERPQPTLNVCHIFIVLISRISAAYLGIWAESNCLRRWNYWYLQAPSFPFLLIIFRDYYLTSTNFKCSLRVFLWFGNFSFVIFQRWFLAVKNWLIIWTYFTFSF